MEKVLQLILGAVTLSSQFISKTHAELCFQLHGRLKRYGEFLDGIREYVSWLETKGPVPVAFCLHDFLRKPGGPNTKIISAGLPLICMAVLDDREWVACGCEQGFILIVNIHENEVAKKWKAHSKAVWALALGRKGTRLVSGSGEGTSKVWDVAGGQCLARFDGHNARISDVNVLKDEKRVVPVSLDGTAQVWEMDTGRAAARGGLCCHPLKVTKDLFNVWPCLGIEMKSLQEGWMEIQEYGVQRRSSS